MEETEDFLNDDFDQYQSENEEDGLFEEMDTDMNIGVEEEESFASDFYRSGSDWTCLVRMEDNIEGTSSSSISYDEEMRKKKRMKQTNLFQMWGVQDKNPESSNIDVKKVNGKKSVDSVGVTGKSTSKFAFQQQGPRVCPFYKKLPGTPFTVDAFRYGNVEDCSVYFLTHFHADHYGGLNKSWSHGPIYCTPLTARLVTMLLSVNSSWIHPLELDTEINIQGVKVTLLDANHCPGAALIHLKLPNGKIYLHTGDFRASKLIQSYPILLNQNKRIDILYLDTTYCNPKYRFPCKEDILNFVVRVTENHMKKKPKSLVIVGAYSIGKECVYLAISKALGVKIYANASRRRILQSFGWSEMSGNLCTRGTDSPLHVLPISSLKFESLESYMETYKTQYESVLAFRPTGWTYSDKIGSHLDLIKPSSKGRITIYGVPYSEHSSFTEMRDFVQFLRPVKIIPTVNVGNAATRDKMQSYFRDWMKGS